MNASPGRHPVSLLLAFKRERGKERRGVDLLEQKRSSVQHGVFENKLRGT